MKRAVVILSALLVVLFLFGCSTEDNLSVETEPSSPQLVLFITSNNAGQMMVSSPDGQSYTEEALKGAIEIAARNGQMLEIIIPEQSFLEQGNDVLIPLAAPPRSSLVKPFISDVTTVWDGMAVTLTDLGLSLGLSWQGALTLASYALFEYELQNPYFSSLPTWAKQAIRAQVHLEMYYHSLAFYYWNSPRFRVVNISFGNLP